MEKEKIIDLYTDFEIVSFENIEMTKLSKILYQRQYKIIVN